MWIIDQWLLGESACSDSLLDDPLRDEPLSDVPFHEARPDSSIGEELTSPHVAEEAMVVAFGFESGSCLVRFLGSNQWMPGIEYYTRREVLGPLRVCFISAFGIESILFIVLRDIVHAAFLQLLACKAPPCMVLRINESLKLAETIVSLHTRLLRPSPNFRPFLQCILHSSRVFDNA